MKLKSQIVWHRDFVLSEVLMKKEVIRNAVCSPCAYALKLLIIRKVEDKCGHRRLPIAN
jgi:hypothetical protein